MREQHVYLRPAWLCLTCLEPWPCAPRRRAFLDKYEAGDRMRLRGILGTLALDAAQDLFLSQEEAYERFARWTFEFGLAEHAARS